MKKLSHILLAEDNPNDVELTLAAFEEIHLANRVDTVSDGEQALDYLRCSGAYANHHPGLPAVLLLDLKMPKVDGLEVLRQVRADPALRCLPVVVLTSSREEPDVLRSYELGVNAYVVKPVDSLSFIEAVSRLGVFWALLNEPPPNGT